MVIENLKLDRQIGQGSHSKVYLAFDQQNRAFAVKILNVNSDYALKKFENENYALKMLDHDNIIKVFNCGTTSDEQLYMVMEYFEGQTLRELLDDRENNLTLKTKVRLIRNIALALGEAHKLKIIHRDIKLSNILLNLEKDEVKITDFGIVLLPESTLTRQISILGTPTYLSPEGFKSSKVCPASDVYSLGAIAYEFFLGKKMFDIGNIRKTYELGLKALTEEPLSPRKINPKFPPIYPLFLKKCCPKIPKRATRMVNPPLLLWIKFSKTVFQKQNFLEG